jgi:hypothetical protein
MLCPQERIARAYMVREYRSRRKGDPREISYNNVILGVYTYTHSYARAAIRRSHFYYGMVQYLRCSRIYLFSCITAARVLPEYVTYPYTSRCIHLS